MPTDSELKEAAERVRRVESGERGKFVYGFDDEEMDNFMYRMLENAMTRDLKLLAKAYLAQRADDGQVSLKGFLDRAPGHFQDWLRSVPVGNFIRDRQREAFQMQGRYDGAMSEECKALFVAEYKMLTDLLKWIE